MAGILVLGPVEAVPDELVRRQFDVNVFGLLAVTRAFLPTMRAKRSGRIVNVSSVLGKYALPGMGVYSASKFAIEAVSDALRIELAPFGLGVVLVEPGLIDTPLMTAASGSMRSYEARLMIYRHSWPDGFVLSDALLKTAASADSVGAVVARAAVAAHPPARYRPGLRNRINTLLLTSVPTGTADRIKSRLSGMATGPWAKSAS